MTKKYNDEFLISELQRFVKENGRVPTTRDMTSKSGYPSHSAYVNHFKVFNAALEIARLKINKKHHVEKLDGTETCAYCGCTINETDNWRYDDNGIRFCKKHGCSGGKGKPDYVKGELDINSEKGLGRAGEILVAKTLKIVDEFDCNRISCGYKIDLYHNVYKKIDVKTSLLSNKYNYWQFTFNAKKEADTYICLGLSSNRKKVEHVWVVPNEGEIRNLQNLGMYDTYRSLSNKRKYEIDSKPYDDVWKTMKLDNCKIMVDKKKDNYIEPIKQNNIVNNTIKQVEQVIENKQYTLDNYM